MTDPQPLPPPEAATAPASGAPQTTTTTTTATAQPAPNEPSMQQLAEAEAELDELVSRKKNVDKELAMLEARIYKFEGSYLEDTSQYGNIIRGFEGYLHSSSRSDKRKHRVLESERLFSQSSVTYQKALELYQRDEMLRQELLEEESALMEIGGDGDEDEVMEEFRDSDSSNGGSYMVEKRKKKKKKKTRVGN